MTSPSSMGAGGMPNAPRFADMLKQLRSATGFTQKHVADGLGYSTQYICDLEQGRRMPSVECVNRICNYLGRGPAGRHEWHLAGARAHGWEV